MLGEGMITLMRLEAAFLSGFGRSPKTRPKIDMQQTVDSDRAFSYNVNEHTSKLHP